MANGQLRKFLHCLHRTMVPPGPTGVTDLQLLERFVCQRDEAAFELLVWRHGPLVHAVCRRLLRQAQDVEDAFQATFLTLVRKAGSIRRRESVASWLYKVAYRISLRARAQAVQRARREQPGVETLLAAPSQPSLWHDLRLVLDEEVHRLSPRYRTTFILCSLEGKTTGEVARLLGCPRGTISSRLARAHEQLRRRLARRGLLLGAGVLATLLSENALAAPLPVVVVTATVRAAVAMASGAVLTGVLATPATTLMEGVLKTMFLKKLQVWGLTLLVLGLVGPGIGMLVYQVLGAEPASAQADGPRQQPAVLAGQDPKKKPPGPTVEETRRDAARERLAELEKAQESLHLQDKELQVAEVEWTERLINARKSLLEMEEQLRLLERQHHGQREMEQRQARQVEQRLQRLQERLEQETARLEQARATATPDALTAIEKLSQQTRKQLQEQMDKARADLEDRFAVSEKMERKRSDQLLRVRQDMMATEERLHLLERQQALQRQRAQASLEDSAEVVRQLRGGAPAGPRSERRPQDMEQKLDQLLREVTELRREVKRLAPDLERPARPEELPGPP